jgi:hypothetical protein
VLKVSTEDSDCTVLDEGDRASLSETAVAAGSKGDSRVPDAPAIGGEGVRPSLSLSGVGKRGIEEAEPVWKKRCLGGDVGVAPEDLIADEVSEEVARAGDRPLPVGELVAVADAELGKLGDASMKGESRN